MKFSDYIRGDDKYLLIGLLIIIWFSLLYIISNYSNIIIAIICTTPLPLFIIWLGVNVF